MREFTRILIIGLIFTFGLFAQRMGMSIDERLKNLTVELSLDEQQQKDMRIIMTDLQKKMQELRAEYGDDRESMREHMQPVRREMNDRILKILDPEQQRKFKAYLNEQRKRYRERMKQ